MIVVSVLVVTYNHENYLARALDSILAQQTQFQVEILVGEDGSDDATPSILREYVARYPQIRGFFRDRSEVIYIRGRPSGRNNMLQLLSQAQGKYLAFCNGDDYWTATDKLQLQVDFLEKNPDFALCQHLTETKWEDGYLPDKTLGCNKDELTVYDFIRRNIFSRRIMKVPETHTSSSLFRTTVLKGCLPPDFNLVFAGDRYLYIWAALKGRVKVLPIVMSVYWQHLQSITKNKFADSQEHRKFWVQNDLEDLQIIKGHLPDELAEHIEEIIGGIHFLDEQNKIPSATARRLENKTRYFEARLLDAELALWRGVYLKQYKRIALYGAGAFAQRLIVDLIDANCALPVILFDSFAEESEQNLCGIQICKPAAHHRDQFDACYLATFTSHDVLEKACRATFGDQVIILNPPCQQAQTP